MYLWNLVCLSEYRANRVSRPPVCTLTGTYSELANATACELCTNYSVSTPGSGNRSLCMCNAGYTGHSDQCMPCAAGKYKDEAGSAGCSSCPSNSSSPAASDNVTDCVCNAGYTGDGGQCMPCAAGKYKDTAGSAAPELLSISDCGPDATQSQASLAANNKFCKCPTSKLRTLRILCVHALRLTRTACSQVLQWVPSTRSSSRRTSRH